MIPTFAARISQTARAAGVMFLETIGGRYYEYIHSFLSSGCFLDALISGQLGPTVWSSFVLPEHGLSTPDVEVQCGTARAAPCTEHDLSRDPECAQRESAPVLLPLSNTAAFPVYPGDATTAPQISPVTTGEILPMKKIMPRLSWPKE